MLDNQTETSPKVTPAVAAQAKRQLEHDPKARKLWQRLAVRRAASALSFFVAFLLFLWWLPYVSRRLPH